MKQIPFVLAALSSLPLRAFAAPTTLRASHQFPGGTRRRARRDGADHRARRKGRERGP